MTDTKQESASIDLKKYDKYYKGAVVIGTCPDGWIIYSRECKDHEHFFVLLNEAFDEEGVVDVRVELKNPTWMMWDARGEK
jgi:hypothetical protein